MKSPVPFLATLTLFFVSVEPANAAVIVGPTSFPVQGGNDTTWGIQFTALDNSALTGFNFTHHTALFAGGNLGTGTIEVLDKTTGTTVFSSPFGNSISGSPEVISFSGLSIPLHGGDVYQLVAHGVGTDERYAVDAAFGGSFPFPDSSSDISVTQGVFNNNPGFQTANDWGAFTELTTLVPEPATLTLFGVATLAAGYFGLRRKKTA
jgi:hypothetical protein